MKAVQRLAQVGFPNRGPSGNGFLSNLKNLKSNGHADEKSANNKQDVTENGTLDGEVNDGKDVTYENNAVDINNVGAKMDQIAINGSDGGAN